MPKPEKFAYFDGVLSVGGKHLKDSTIKKEKKETEEKYEKTKYN